MVEPIQHWIDNLRKQKMNDDMTAISSKAGNSITSILAKEQPAEDMADALSC
jgi:hypothetical protein